MKLELHKPLPASFHTAAHFKHIIVEKVKQVENVSIVSLLLNMFVPWCFFAQMPLRITEEQNVCLTA